MWRPELDSNTICVVQNHIDFDGRLMKLFSNQDSNSARYAVAILPAIFSVCVVAWGNESIVRFKFSLSYAYNIEIVDIFFKLPSLIFDPSGIPKAAPHNAFLWIGRGAGTSSLLITYSVYRSVRCINYIAFYQLCECIEYLHQLLQVWAVRQFSFILNQWWFQEPQ